MSSQERPKNHPEAKPPGHEGAGNDSTDSSYPSQSDETIADGATTHFRPLPAVTITDSAQEYLAGLLAKQNCEGIAIRMFVSSPGTPQAETCIAYCRPGEEKDGDIKMALNGLDAWFESRSVPYLEDAKVDYSPDRMGGQLTIRAPNSKMPKINDDSPIEDIINYVLANDVNPGLASHGGNVSLVEVTEAKIAILKFGGGCQGCSAVDLTLKSGVEKTLMEKVPGIQGVRDITDHSDSSQAYYS